MVKNNIANHSSRLRVSRFVLAAVLPAIYVKTTFIAAGQ